MVRDRGDKGTNDLLSWEPPVVAVGYTADVAGKGDLQNKIARLVSRALRDAREDGVSRPTISVRMAEELGRSVSDDMLDKWASEAAEQHRIPLDAFIALVKATEAYDLLGFIPAMFGFIVVPKKFKGLVELQLIADHKRDLDLYEARVRAEQRSER